MKLCLAGLAVAAVAALPSPAPAGRQDEPAEASLSLAWRGAAVRLLECSPRVAGVGQRAELELVDWSGDVTPAALLQPKGGSPRFFAGGTEHPGSACVEVRRSSPAAGLARLRLSVSGTDGAPVLRHDFLVGWMALAAPVLSASRQAKMPLAPAPGTFPVPGSDLVDVAGSGPTDFRADVVGAIPLRAGFAAPGLGHTAQLPRDAAALATALGVSSTVPPMPSALVDFTTSGGGFFGDATRVLETGTGSPSICLLRSLTTFAPAPSGGLIVTRTPVFRPLAAGPHRVVVSSDEHGEAHALWYPGVGFDQFNSFAALSGRAGGCELQNVNPLAQPAIRALASYPSGPLGTLGSNTIEKTIVSLYNRQVRCLAAGTSVPGQFSERCVLSTADIDGAAAPLVDEIVCFASNADRMTPFVSAPGESLPAFLGGGTVEGALLSPAGVAALGKVGEAVVCERLDAGGKAAVELFSKGPPLLIADLVDEGLLRALNMNSTGGPARPGVAEPQGLFTVTSTAPATPAQIQAVNQAETTVELPDGQRITNEFDSKPEIRAPVRLPARPSIARADLVTPVAGKPYLLVRVSGPAERARIQIQIAVEAGVRTVARTVRTNRLVKVAGLPISGGVKSVRVTALGRPLGSGYSRPESERERIP